MTGTFTFNDRYHPYLDAVYNGTRINERAVEVPIALDLLNASEFPLEIGAVLPHYIPTWPNPFHTCIDLNEDYPQVHNIDVLEFMPSFKFDLIICISTLDHLNNADEVQTAIHLMKSWLVTDGQLFVTLPANQPPEVGGGAWLDELVLSGDLDMMLTRMDKTDPLRHTWEQVENDTPAKGYNDPSPMANTLYILEWTA